MKSLANAKSKILEKMKEGSVTAEWDAVVSYNREMANHVLIQDYVDQFSNSGWYAPINYTAHLRGTQDRLDFVDVVLSEPLISFVSQDVYIKPTLRVTWFAKSGTIISSHGDDVRYENVLNPLMGPTLVAILPVSSGAVEESKVYLDISGSSDFVFNFSAVGDENEQVGSQLQAYLIQKLSDEHQRIVISEIVNIEGSIWKPESFKIDVLVPPALRETRMLDDAVNDGAVVVSIALEGSSPGGVPVEPLYMIPSEEGFTSAIVIRNKALMDKIIQKGFAKMGNEISGASTLEPIALGNKEFYQLKATDGAIKTPKDIKFPVDDLKFHIPFMYLAKESDGISGRSRFTCSIIDDSLMIEWNGYKPFWIQYGQATHGGELNWKKELKGKFLIEGDTEVSLSVGDDSTGSVLLVPVDEVDNQLPYTVLDYWNDISELYIETGIEVEIDDALQRFAAHVPDFNTFALNNILFKNHDVVSLKEAYTPGDLVVFGNIRPQLTAIQIDDPLPKVIKGQTYQFTITPTASAPQIKWAVEPLADSKGLLVANFGSIDERTGLYTAPAELGEDGFLQVKVTAIHEQSEAKCFALLTVSNQSILVSPEMFKVSFNAEFPVRAMAHDKSPLKPVLPTDTDGKIVASETEMNVWIYSPGPRPAPSVGYKLETIEFKSESNGSTNTVVALCLASGLILMKYDVGDKPGTYEFYGESATGIRKKGKWKLLEGPGVIDYETGIYTADPEVSEPLIIVHGLFNDGEDIGVDVFKLDPTGKSLATLIRRGKHPGNIGTPGDEY